MTKLFIKIDNLRTVSEANQAEHWTFKHKRKKIQKNRINLAISGQIRSKLIEMKTPLTIKLTRIALRKLDDDNLITAFKYIRDYIASIIFPGLAPGRADDSPLLKWEYAQEKGMPREYSVILEITKN